MAFVGLNVIDAGLTVALILNGYLCMELNPFMRYLFVANGPPHYAIGLFLIVKISLAVGLAFALAYMTLLAPRLKRWVLALPVFMMTGVCIINLGGLLW